MLVSYNDIKQTEPLTIKTLGFAPLLKDVFAVLTAGATASEKQGEEYILSGRCRV